MASPRITAHTPGALEKAEKYIPIEKQPFGVILGLGRNGMPD